MTVTGTCSPSGVKNDVIPALLASSPQPASMAPATTRHAPRPPAAGCRRRLRGLDIPVGLDRLCCLRCPRCLRRLGRLPHLPELTPAALAAAFAAAFNIEDFR